MISPELLRRYPFFAGLDSDQLVAIANAAEDLTVEADTYFFHEGDELSEFYVVVQGQAAIGMELPDTAAVQSVAGQLTGHLQTRLAIVSTAGPGEVFGWSALVPPHSSSAAAVAQTPCRAVKVSVTQLQNAFEDDPQFAYLMMQKAAQVIRGRLRDLRIESLASFVN